MTKKRLHYLILITSAVLLLLNLIFPEKWDLGFYLRALSNVLIIVAMVITINYNAKKEEGS